MTMPTIEDLCKAFGAAAYSVHKWDGIPAQSQRMYRAGVLAVLDALKPVVAEAFAAGDRKIPGYGEIAENYADRIIAQLKREKP